MIPGVPPGKYVGRIKSFNKEKGFGFIDCPEARSKFGRDVFIHKAQVGIMDVGSEVTFVVEMNRDKMPQARDAAKFGERYGATTDGFRNDSKGKGAGKGSKKERKRQNKEKAKAKAAPGGAPATGTDGPGSNGAAVEDSEAPDAAAPEGKAADSAEAAAADSKEAPAAADAGSDEGDFNCDADSGGEEASGPTKVASEEPVPAQEIATEAVPAEDKAANTEDSTASVEKAISEPVEEKSADVPA